MADGRVHEHAFPVHEDHADPHEHAHREAGSQPDASPHGGGAAVGRSLRLTRDEHPGAAPPDHRAEAVEVRIVDVHHEHQYDVDHHQCDGQTNHEDAHLARARVALAADHSLPELVRVEVALTDLDARDAAR